LGGFSTGLGAAAFFSWCGKTPLFFALMAQRPRLWYIFDREYFSIPFVSRGLRDTVLGFVGAIAAETMGNEGEVEGLERRRVYIAIL